MHSICKSPSITSLKLCHPLTKDSITVLKSKDMIRGKQTKSHESLENFDDGKNAGSLFGKICGNF